MSIIHNIPKINHTDSNNFFLIAGPCIVEESNLTFQIARSIKEITDKLCIPFIFKASYKKANRSSIESFTGIGDEEALNILKSAGEELSIPILTDIHLPDEAEVAAQYADVLQIPAFLCRQTDLLIAAGNTGKIINIKKGQFLSADLMKHAIDKIKSTGNQNVMVTDRGTMFGYQDLIVDYRNIVKMQQFDVPVVLDCTHSLQQPNQASGTTGGDAEMIETIAKAGVAVGADGLFIETHPDPESSKSDSATMLKLDKLEELLIKLQRIREAIS